MFKPNGLNDDGLKCSNNASAFWGPIFVYSRGMIISPMGRILIACCQLIFFFFEKQTTFYQYEWFLESKSTIYSAFIDRNTVENGTLVKDLLKRYNQEDARRMIIYQRYRVRGVKLRKRDLVIWYITGIILLIPCCIHLRYCY